MMDRGWFITVCLTGGLSVESALAMGSGPIAGRELRVTPGGLSIEQARDRIREAKATDPDRDFIVTIHGGTHRLTRPLRFGPEDSAAPGRTITYAAADGERPVFTSGAPVEGWRKCEDDPPGLAGASKGKLWVASFPPGVDSVTTLFDARGRLPRAIGPEIKPLLPRTDPRVADGKTLIAPPGSFREYETLRDIEIWIVPTFQWCHNLLPVESIDSEAGVLRTRVAGTYPLAQREKGYDPSRFRICNAPDVLDEPGEWFADSRARMIWLRPRDDRPPEGVVAPTLDELLVVSGDPDANAPVSGLVFDGLTFSHARRVPVTDADAGLQHDWEFWDKPNAMVRFRWTESCAVRNCLLTDSGGGGIRFDLLSRSNQVENCEISRLGGTGLALIGDKIGRDFVNRRNVIRNNHIHRVGQEIHHSAAIFMWQSGENDIAHNRVHHTPYNGFSVGGIMPPAFSKQWRERSGRELTRVIDYDRLPFGEDERSNDSVTWTLIEPFLFTRDNVFSYNEIYRNMELLGDGNPFYMRMAAPGNILRRNYIHHTLGAHSAAAVRFDGQQWGAIFEENVVFRNTGAAVSFHKANRMVNNILVDIHPNVQVLHGGRAPSRTGADIETEQGYFFRCTPGPSYPAVGVPDYPHAVIERNVMVQCGETFSEFYGDTAHWKGRARAWTEFDRIKAVDRNLFWAPRQELKALNEWLAARRAMKQDVHSAIADPLFVDFDTHDFRFRPDSPAAALGIVSVDRREAGLTSDFPNWLAARVEDDAERPLSIEGITP